MTLLWKSKSLKRSKTKTLHLNNNFIVIDDQRGKYVYTWPSIHFFSLSGAG